MLRAGVDEVEYRINYGNNLKHKAAGLHYDSTTSQNLNNKIQDLPTQPHRFIFGLGGGTGFGNVLFFFSFPLALSKMVSKLKSSAGLAALAAAFSFLVSSNKLFRVELTRLVGLTAQKFVEEPFV